MFNIFTIFISVTLTISSDEDEPSSTSNSGPGFPSPAHSSTGGESPSAFPHFKTAPKAVHGRFKRLLMQDEVVF